MRKAVSLAGIIMSLVFLPALPAGAQSSGLTQFQLCVTVEGDSFPLTAESLLEALTNGSLTIVSMDMPETCLPLEVTTSWEEYLLHDADFFTKLDNKLDQIRKAKGLPGIRRGLVGLRDLANNQLDWMGTIIPLGCWTDLWSLEQKMLHDYVSYANKGIRGLDQLSLSLIRFARRDLNRAENEYNKLFNMLDPTESACIAAEDVNASPTDLSS